MSAASKKTYAIHPAFGIARMGNAQATSDPSSFYLGAESPGEVPNENQPYKTGGKIKKQAQRFRIYEFEDGRAVREITLQESDIKAITWTVHLANRKSALDTDADLGTPARPAVVPPKLYGLDAEPPNNGNPHYWPAATRNANVPADQRRKMCIDPGPQTVSADAPEKTLAAEITLFPEQDQPQSKNVTIGTLRVEQGTGRLLVFPADGTSEAWDAKAGRFSTLPKVTDFGNNDGWYDDTADGPVQATITFQDGSSVTLDQPRQRAWVISSAPRYAPGFDWITTLYDLAVSECASPADLDAKPSFARDIYPMLRCASMLRWVSSRGSQGHSTPSGYYLAPARMNVLQDNSAKTAPARAAIFKRIRNPNIRFIDRASVQLEMPQVSADITRNKVGDYDVAVITPLQYARFRKWSEGDFDADGTPEYVPFDKLDVAAQPAALDHAALEGSCGTPLYPGIESWRIMRTKETYADGTPLRISAQTQPGDLTIGNALPWQADYLDCNDIWWPVQRPNEVTRNGEILQHWVPHSWIPTEDKADYNKMVDGWWQLGFVVKQDSGRSYAETEGSAGEPST